MPAQALRESVSRLRDALPAAEREAKSEQIWGRLAALPEFQGARQALFYVSFKSEVETSLMRALCRELGIGVAVPRGEPGEKRMQFYSLEGEEELESGPYGILQPPADPLRLADLGIPSVVIVPGLVFDLKCHRLGWGGGYYDRFLAGPGRGLPALGLAFECQVLESVPVEPHDVALAAVVTESRVIRAKG
jgi:5-formyltetrahydrofolate cyclo-ligase